MRQFCAECGQEMTRREFGAWNSCCKNRGYWADVVPERNDWHFLGYEGPGAMIHCHLDDDSPPLFFYPTAKWPERKKPVFPRN